MTKAERLRCAQRLRLAMGLEDWTVTRSADLVRLSRNWVSGFTIGGSSDPEVFVCHVVVHFAAWPFLPYFLAGTVGGAWEPSSIDQLARLCLRLRPDPVQSVDDEEMLSLIHSTWYVAGVRGLLGVQHGEMDEARAALERSLRSARSEWPQMRFIEDVLRRLGQSGDEARAAIDEGRRAVFDQLLAESAVTHSRSH